jgi:hypothetical protein
MSATAVDPELKSFDFRIQQVAPGRYEGEFEAGKSGNYFLTIDPGPGYAPQLAGVSVPYSTEFRDRQTNLALLRSLSQLKPNGGRAGALIEGDMRPETLPSLLQVDTFRDGLAPAVTSRDAWPWFVVLTACLFVLDVFLRRVALRFAWVWESLSWLRHRWARQEQPAEVEQRLQRLRGRKAAVAEELDERRAAARLEPTTETEPSPESPADPATQPWPAQLTQEEKKAPLAPDAPEEESYTTRLLKAKRKAWKDEE